MKSEYLIKDGPYCYECGTYLGSEYSDGDQCLECWENANGFEPVEALDEKGIDS